MAQVQQPPGTKRKNFNQVNVKSYLASNPNALEELVLELASPQQLENWLSKKAKGLSKSASLDRIAANDGEVPRNNIKRSPVQEHGIVNNDVHYNNTGDSYRGSVVKSNQTEDKKETSHGNHNSKLNNFQIINILTTSVNGDADQVAILYELARHIATTVSADHYSLYTIIENQNALSLYQPDRRDNAAVTVPIETGSTMVAYVAKTRCCLNLRPEQILLDDRFPKGISYEAVSVDSIICQPIILPDHSLAGVLVLIKTMGSKSKFSPTDEEAVTALLQWGSLAFCSAKMMKAVDKQRQLQNVLFSVSQSIFNEVTKRNTLLEIVMVSAKKLLNADRCALFLVDYDNEELYADLFDESDPSGEIKIVPKEKDIRFSVEKGIAGYAVKHGQLINVADAYKDPRFNREIDVMTGYTTRSILCMPLINKGRCIGAMQMVNKIGGNFTTEDEDAFRIFTVYCNLALHTSEIYIQLRKSESRRKVALDSFYYHSGCTDEETDDMIAKPYLPRDEVPPRLETIDFTADDAIATFSDNYILPRLFLHMFRELFGTSGFNVFDLCRFTLTCRKNYRRVPYHNWHHAFNVTHSMYYIIKNSPDVFDRLECLALFIACLCHDLDHRGTNNAFQVKSENPLADLYSTSVLEQHHFNMTIMILQRHGHTILSNLSKEDHEAVMNYIHDAIIATDLALYFGNRSALQKLVDNNEFDWSVSRHRSRVRGLAMTACDLIAVAKPWSYQFATVKQIFAEFYEQGDVEKKLGITPIPMMDRDREDELPANQVGFINGICLPCYELLAYLLPNTQPMVDNIKLNLNQWQTLSDEQKKKVLDQKAITVSD